MNKVALEFVQEALERAEPEELNEAMEEVLRRHMPRRVTKELPDPGKPLAPGEDGCVEAQEHSHLERIVGIPNFLPVAFLEEGMICSRAVGRVALTEAHARLPAGSGWGTGFLVSNSLFLTNNHVIPSKSFARKVQAQFNYQKDYFGNPEAADIYSFDPDGYFHTNIGLDYTVLRVASRPRPRSRLSLLGRGIEGMERPGGGVPSGEPQPLDPTYFGTAALSDLYHQFFKVPPGWFWGHLQLAASTYAQDDHINIVQHPDGRHKEVALQQNKLTEIYTNVVHYSTDTEPGSSGSPVFNNEWDLIALHHAAGHEDPPNSDNWIDNEGMRIDKIIADLQSDLAGTTTGDAILAEIGITP